MRVLMTTDTVGGVWTFTQELASGLLERGCYVVLFSLGRTPDQEQLGWARRTQSQWSERFYFQSTDIPLEWMQENEGAFRDAAPMLLRLIETFQPHVVHCNQFCFGALPSAAPRLVTAHSDVLGWAEACGRAPLQESRWLTQYLALTSAGLNRAAAVVAPTQWMLDALRKSFTLRQRKCVIGNGRTIDGAASPSIKKLQAITAGRLWDEAKGVDMLAAVRSPVPLLVAGSASCEVPGGPSQIGDTHSLGPLSQQELIAHFRESAIYICTSRYEPFGLAPLEAALCGCAVLANDLPSLREVWGDGALYFEGAGSLSRLLDALANAPALLKSAQLRSRERAQRYTREAMTAGYLSLYAELTANNGNLLNVA